MVVAKRVAKSASGARLSKGTENRRRKLASTPKEKSEALPSADIAKASSEGLGGIAAAQFGLCDGLLDIFTSVALKEQFGEFCQFALHESHVGSLETRWKSALAMEIDFIPNPRFNNTGAAERIFGQHLLAKLEQDQPTGRSSRLADLPSHLARLCETKLLTAEQEIELFERMNFLRYCANKLRLAAIDKSPKEATLLVIHGLIRAANWHRDMIVKSNMRLVISIVKKFVNANNHFDDLLSDGIMALIRAVEKFDFDLGFRFSTYATQVVRRNAYRNVMTKHKDRLKMGTSLEELNVDLDDRMVASGISPDRWHMLRTKLAGLLDRLDRRERLIVRARFSLGSHRKVQTLQRIADCLGVSKERVRQLEGRALEKLRALAGLDELPEFTSS